jgi:mitotic spindle assembly checkpoint protein MAD2
LSSLSHCSSSILYQRGIYPPDTFKQVKKYGLSILVTADDAVKAYLDSVLRQVSRALHLHLPRQAFSVEWIIYY